MGKGQRTKSPSGRRTVLINRVGWARTYLSKAGLLINVRITINIRGGISMNEVLEQIKEEHIIFGIDQLDRFGWDSRRDSTKFDLSYKGKTYPPKEIIRHAGIAATNEDPGRFGGGKESNDLLIRLGFTVIDKITGLPIEISNLDINQELRIEKDKIEDIFNNQTLSNTEKIHLMKIRIGQGKFRSALLSIHKSCMLCNVKLEQLLIASHIKPWRDCTSNERLDFHNGLLLCPNHDYLFDKGYITFDYAGEIVIADTLSESDRIFMNVQESMNIHFTEASRTYMEWHRNHIFKM